jgi:hypothetical protein
MPAENLAWILPPMKEAYAHRQEILSLWQKIEAMLFGGKRTIAFTGCPGIGKTVLFDFLTGLAYRQGYMPPPMSQKDEKGKMTDVKKRIRLVVIPGQNSTPRLDSIDDLFTDKNTVDGVIHVVANGFAEIRNDVARAALVSETKIETTENFLQLQREIEMKDLDETCSLLRRSIQKHKRPKWLLVAVTKIDLYYGSIETARARYSPFSQSEFASRLKELQNQVGSDNFRWDAQPVCAWLEDFSWNGERTATTLNVPQRDQYIYNFGKALKEFC